MTGKELDRAVIAELRTLSKDNAIGVAQHLVMVARHLAEEDFTGAYAHAETAVRRAGRVPAAREALGWVAYRDGDWALALREFRTARRLSGSEHLLPVLVDCERGLGRLDKALDMATGPSVASLGRDGRVELAVVVSGIRRDLGDPAAAAATLEALPELRAGTGSSWPALAYAYAEALFALGRDDEGRDWLARAAEADEDGRTDAGERLAELDGFIVLEEPDDEMGEDSDEVDEDSAPS